MNMPHTGLDPVAFAFLKLSHLKEANKGAKSSFYQSNLCEKLASLGFKSNNINLFE